MGAWLHDENRAQGSRARQEDDYGVFELPPQLEAGELLLVLADGMGGEQAGAFASALAVRGFIGAYDLLPAVTIPERLERTLHHVNGQMALEVAGDPEHLHGMGCTLLAVVLAEEGLYWISVGDSPLWLWRRGRLHRLNQDHAYRSVLAERVSAGEMSAEEAACHPDRNALISAVTGEELELIDVSRQPFALKPNDQILLASDGILTLSEREIGTVLKAARNLASPCEPLLAAVMSRQHPQQDNTTVLWVKQAPTAAAESFWRQPWVRNTLLLGVQLLALLGAW
ncbi:MAG TPA: SpoIIE family protein phosphatase [Candidatus Competibacter sp.]|nr:SpoIIE family protein phosphatase [Candidatus Competibacter sp.]